MRREFRLKRHKRAGEQLQPMGMGALQGFVNFEKGDRTVLGEANGRRQLLFMPCRATLKRQCRSLQRDVGGTKGAPSGAYQKGVSS